jgi:hypothetical protein
MDGKQVVVFGVGVVCALTLAVAAASVAGSGTSGSLSGSPVFDVESGLVGDLLGALQFDGGPIASVLNVLVYLPGLVGLAVIGYGITNYLGAAEMAGPVVMVLLGLLVMALFPMARVDQDFLRKAEGASGELAPTVESAVSSGPEITVFLTPVVGLVVLVGLGVAAVVVRRGDEREDPSTKPTAPGSMRDLQGVGAAAGRAAEELSAEESFENAVYEAWTRMARSLSVEDPETTTPGEFADHAVAAGLDRADVAELTRLFEGVRYGQTPVTADRRERAQAALERIEATYAKDDVTDAGERDE